MSFSPNNYSLTYYPHNQIYNDYYNDYNINLDPFIINLNKLLFVNIEMCFFMAYILLLYSYVYNKNYIDYNDYIYDIIPLNNNTRNISYKNIQYNLFFKKYNKTKYLLYENDILQRLSTIPNVINILGIGQDKYNVKYNVLPYLDKWTELYKIDYSIPDLLTIYIKIATTLKNIHSYNITHNDIKPDNIMVNKDLDIMMIDFELTDGTTGYESPESMIQPDFNNTSESDIWALGVTILYTYINDSDSFYELIDFKQFKDDNKHFNKIQNRINDILDLLIKTNCVDYKKLHICDIKCYTSYQIKILLKKILQVNPDHRITLSEIIKLLQNISNNIVSFK